MKARGDDALVEALAPARYKGEIMLFNDRTIWFVKPGLRKPVSISARQRLTGLAANGDIASTNYARDYEGTIVGEEAVDGDPAWKLELKARAKNVTYDRIRSWISKKRRLGAEGRVPDRRRRGLQDGDVRLRQQAEDARRARSSSSSAR